MSIGAHIRYSGQTILSRLATPSMPFFSVSLAYRWTSTNSPDYGWILRYPEGKESITGYEFESWHYRYLGVDLARAVAVSGMTYDEFYCLYLKPWNGEGENKPKDSILEASDWHNLIAAETAE